MSNPVLGEAVAFDSSAQLDDTSFGVVVTPHSVFQNHTEEDPFPNLKPGGKIYDALLEVDATLIRFPTSKGPPDAEYPESKYYDFTNPTNLQAVYAVIDMCAALGLSYSLTISYQAFFDFGFEEGEERGMNLELAPEYSDILVDILDYADGLGVTITDIKLGNEYPGDETNPDVLKLTPQEYGQVAAEMALMVGQAVEEYSQAAINAGAHPATLQDPRVLLDTGPTPQDSVTGESKPGSIPRIIAQFEGHPGAQYVDGVDLHESNVTLHPSYEEFLGVGENGHAAIPTQLMDNVGFWEEHGVGPGNPFNDLEYAVLAWSYPQDGDGGPNLKNASLAILHAHAYSAAGVSTIINWSIVGSHENSLSNYNGDIRAGAYVIDMMSNSLEGLAAIDINDGLSVEEEASAPYIFRAFTEGDTVVLYVIGRSDLSQDFQMDLDEFLGGLEYFQGGISTIDADLLEMAEGETNPEKLNVQTTITEFTQAELEAGAIGDAEVSFTLDGYEIMELTITAEGIFGTDAQTETLNGTAGDDFIFGLDGRDWLKGNAGEDVLVGGDGSDIFIGGADADTMTGGAGSDVFYFNSGGLDWSETITDFNIDEDFIVLDFAQVSTKSDLVFWRPGGAGNDWVIGFDSPDLDGNIHLDGTAHLEFSDLYNATNILIQ